MSRVNFKINLMLAAVLLFNVCCLAEIEHPFCKVWANWNDMPESCQEFCSECLVWPFVSRHQPPENYGGLRSAGGNDLRGYGSEGWCEYIAKGVRKCRKLASGVAGVAITVVDVVFDDYIPDQIDPFHNLECQSVTTSCGLEYQSQLSKMIENNENNEHFPKVPVTQETGQSD